MENIKFNIPKCQVCGADDFRIGRNNAYICNYCESRMYPVHNDEVYLKSNLANSKRELWDFDEAYELYEQLLSENPNDSNSIWGAFLSFYGITYEKEKSIDDSIKMIPTCHKTVFTPVSDFKYYSLLDEEQLKMSETIEVLRKQIVSEMEDIKEKYDVFICYKQNEIENSEKKTIEASWARDIYELLTHELKLNVFYAEKSLQGHKSSWEPHIYSALKSSSLMLVLASNTENVNSQWVKNEWKRYSSFAKDDKSKTLIGIYTPVGIKESQFPYRFLNKQLLNHDDIDFKENLIKLVSECVKNARKPVVVKKQIESPILKPKPAGEEQLLNIAKNFLDNGRFDMAKDKANQVLEKNDTSKQAYKIKFLSENGVKVFDDLIGKNEKVEGIKDFDNLYVYSMESERTELLSLAERILKDPVDDVDFLRIYLQYKQDKDTLHDILKETVKNKGFQMSGLIADVLISNDVNDYIAYFAKYLCSKNTNNYVDLIADDNFINNEYIIDSANAYLNTYPNANENIIYQLESSLYNLRSNNKSISFEKDKYVIDINHIGFDANKEIKKASRNDKVLTTLKFTAKHHWWMASTLSVIACVTIFVLFKVRQADASKMPFLVAMIVLGAFDIAYFIVNGCVGQGNDSEIVGQLLTALGGIACYVFIAIVFTTNIYSGALFIGIPVFLIILVMNISGMSIAGVGPCIFALILSIAMLVLSVVFLKDYGILKKTYVWISSVCAAGSIACSIIAPLL